MFRQSAKEEEQIFHIQELTHINELQINEKEQINAKEYHQKRSFTRSEKQGIVILFTLYLIQGISLGFFDTIPLIWSEEDKVKTKNKQGHDLFVDIGIFSLVTYPFAFKLLFAPIEDVYYNKKFGKRKSYIIPLQYFMVIIYFCSSFFIDQLIHSRSVLKLTYIGFILNFLSAIQDIAVDGWQLTLLRNQNVGWGSVCQSIGQTVGILLGGTVFVQLNSIKFCNKFIYASPQQYPLLNAKYFFQIISSFVLIITLIIHIFVKEVNPKSDDAGAKGIKEVIFSMKGFFINKNLRFLIFAMLFWRLGFQFVEKTFSIKMIQKGYSKEVLVTTSFFLIPIEFLFSYLTGKFVKQGEEFKIFHYTFFMRLADNIISFLLVMQFNGKIWPYSIFLFGSFAISSIYQSIGFVNMGAFINRIGDEEIGGTYLTAYDFLNLQIIYSKDFQLQALFLQ